MMDFLGSLFPGNRSHLSQPLCNLTLDLFPQPLTTATHLCNVAGDIEIDLWHFVTDHIINIRNCLWFQCQHLPLCLNIIHHYWTKITLLLCVNCGAMEQITCSISERKCLLSSTSDSTAICSSDCRFIRFDLTKRCGLILGWQQLTCSKPILSQICFSFPASTNLV